MVNQVIRGATDEIRQLQLGLVVVIHASLVKEAINLLPPPDEFVPVKGNGTE